MLSEASVWNYFCTCGFSSADGAEAANHVKLCHDGVRSYGTLTLASRIQLYIYSIGHNVYELAMQAEAANKSGK